MTVTNLSISIVAAAAIGAAYRKAGLLASIAIGRKLSITDATLRTTVIAALVGGLATAAVISAQGWPAGLIYVPIAAGAGVDQRSRIIPDFLTGAGAIVAGVLILASKTTWSAGDATAGVAAAALIAFLLNRTLQRFGHADVKLLLVLGGAFGPMSTFLATCIAIVTISAERQIRVKPAQAFGSHLALGLALALTLLSLPPQ